MNEVMVIAEARCGSEDAFTALYKKHLPYVKAVGRAILRTNDLDDLCQETFLLAFTRIRNFHGNSNFRTWVTRIAMNQCLMILRRNRQLSNGASQLVQLENDNASDDLLEQCIFVTEDSNLRSVAARFDLPKMLSHIKPEQRRILEMAYLEDLPDQEIADQLGITLASVKSKLHHAKKRIREAQKRAQPFPQSGI
jgi:RNA polymerase sigma-70 factor (ECF subfamily)